MKYIDAISRYYKFLSYSSTITTNKKTKKSMHISGKLSIKIFMVWLFFVLFMVLEAIAFDFADSYYIHINIRFIFFYISFKYIYVHNKRYIFYYCCSYTEQINV